MTGKEGRHRVMEGIGVCSNLIFSVCMIMAYHTPGVLCSAFLTFTLIIFICLLELGCLHQVSVNIMYWKHYTSVL